MTTKRQINHKAYDPSELAKMVFDLTPTQRDIETAKRNLANNGITAERVAQKEQQAAIWGTTVQPYNTQVMRLATEIARLDALTNLTGANFSGQIGRWSWESVETVTRNINDYLNRRISGQHARWTANH